MAISKSLFVHRYHIFCEELQQEPPLEWHVQALLEGPWGWALILCPGCVLLLVALALHTVGGFLVGCVILLWTGFIYGRSRRRVLDPLHVELAALIACCFTSIALSLACTIPEDPLFRHRAMGIVAVGPKGWICMMNFRMKPYACFLLWSCGTDLFSTVLASFQHGDDYPIRVFIALLIHTLIYLSFGYLQMLRNTRLYNTQKRLASEKQTVETLLQNLIGEKDAVESLLSMMCDATCWISCSGNSVTRSDSRFDTIIGQAMLGACFIDAFPMAEDRKRIQDCLVRGPLDNQPSPVVLLPVTLRCSTDENDLTRAELFIVDRRAAMTNIIDAVPSGTQLGFFIGIRLCAVIPPRGCEGNDELQPNVHDSHQCVLSETPSPRNEPASEQPAACPVLSRVVVVRHAERADSNWDSQWSTSDDAKAHPLDPPITEAGFEQARDLSLSLQKLGKFHVVVTSPYLRCVQTALVIAEHLDCFVLLDHQLGEVYGPEIFGDTVPHKRPFRKWHSLVRALNRPGVQIDHSRVQAARVLGTPVVWPESRKNALKRYAYRFLVYLRRARHTRQSCVLVTHGHMMQSCFSVLPAGAPYHIISVDHCAFLVATCCSSSKEVGAAEAKKSMGHASRRYFSEGDADEEQCVHRFRSIGSDLANTPLFDHNEMVQEAALRWWDISFSNIKAHRTDISVEKQQARRLKFIEQLGPTWNDITRLLGALPPMALRRRANAHPHCDAMPVDLEECQQSFSTENDTVSSMHAFRNPRGWHESHLSSFATNKAASEKSYTSRGEPEAAPDLFSDGGGFGNVEFGACAASSLIRRRSLSAADADDDT